METNLDLIEKRRLEMDKISSTFCPAKWLQVSLHLLTGHTHSCYLPPAHKIPLEEINKDPSALHNTKHKKAMREKMLNGKRPKECGICWTVEDLPGSHHSDRHLRATEDWSHAGMEDVKAAGADQNINPRYVEVSFSNACNFKCSYCSPVISTEWMKEIRREGHYHLSDAPHQKLAWFEENDQIPLPEDANPYLDAFWKWWPELVKSLMYLRITGGEPLLSKSTYKLLHWLHTHGAPELNLVVNSNLGISRIVMQRYLDLAQRITETGAVKSHLLHTSLDAWGARAEYMRFGLDLDIFMSNFEAYLRAMPKSSLSIICTFSNLSVTGFREFLEKILELRQTYNNEHRQIHLDIPHLQRPYHQSALILTSDYGDYVREGIEFMEAHRGGPNGFTPVEIGKVRRILQWMQNAMDPNWLVTQRRNFYLFFAEHDRRRGTDFLNAFPEMTDFWHHCKRLAEAAPHVGDLLC